jgi:hypothetical protein
MRLLLFPLLLPACLLGSIRVVVWGVPNKRTDSTNTLIFGELTD